MAIVKHEIPPGSGRVYLYEHHRVLGRGVVCTYLGRSDMVKEVSSIPEEGYPVTAKKYPEGHKAGNRAEISEYGKEDYNTFQEWINENVPEGELAGSNLPDGTILMRKDIPEEHKGKLILHERTEGEVITGKELDTEPRGKGRTVTKDHMNIRQKRKVEYVMREYESGRLKSSSGEKVINRRQAVAIAYSQARKVR